MAHPSIIFISFCVCINFVAAKYEAVYAPPKCPNFSGYIYIPHPAPCYFYACYGGFLLSASPYKCPTDPKYYAMLDASGVQNPCTTCPPESPTTKTTTTSEAPSPDTTTTATAVPTTTTTPSNGGEMTPEQTTAAETTKEITSIVTQSHVHGAKLASDSTTLRNCLQLCEDTSDCFGFDFDVTKNTCWFHDVTSICGVPEMKNNCTHFRLFDGCSSGPPDGETGDATTVAPPETTTLPFIVTFSGRHIYDGTVIPLAVGMATADNCIAICRLDSECVGVDFDTKTSSCWIHTEDTVCGDLIIKSTCTHYRLKNVCDSDSGSVTTTTVQPTDSPQNSGNNGGGSGSNPAAGVVPNGYFEAVEGYHLPGGLKVFSGVSLQQCLDACLVTPYCLALDYDAIDSSCYFHFRETYCRQPYELAGNYHFKRMPCIEGVPNDAAATWYHFHAQNGAEFCTGCPIGFCLEACYSDPNCAGIDFDIRNLGCYLFEKDYVCGPLIPKDYCIHMSRDTCVPSTLGGASIDSLILVLYPPPATLPTGWEAYPGYRVRNGVQVGDYDMDPDDCVSLCDKDSLCLAGDYDTADGSCWLHLGQHRQCSQIEASDSVYHFKKETCGNVFGTLQRYVSPIRTA